MPNTPVVIRRWEVIAAFCVVVALAAGSVQWSNRNITRRVNAAEARIVQNAVRNAAQDEVRRQLVEGFRAADMRTCLQIEALKAIVRPEPFDAQMAREFFADANIDPDSERGRRLLDQLQAQNARERRELAPHEC